MIYAKVIPIITVIRPTADKNSAPKLAGTVDCNTALSSSSDRFDFFAFATRYIQRKSKIIPTKVITEPTGIKTLIEYSKLICD